jgi:hypothetical protein
MCAKNTYFIEFIITYVFKKHAQIIWYHVQKRGLYRVILNMAKNVDYIGPYSENKYYGAEIVTRWGSPNFRLVRAK